MQSSPIYIQAPAKINLNLHVTARREDGYHTLQSFVVFADLADEIEISPASEFSFEIDGLFAGVLEERAMLQNNLVVRAARGIAELVQKPLHCSIRLTKNIPVGAGLGGGSADAAATIKGLLQFWNVTIDQKQLSPFLESLGADVPVCYEGKSCFVEGIGEIIHLLPDAIPQTHVLLIYPGVFCSTPQVFQNFEEPFLNKTNFPTVFQDQDALFAYLKTTQNSLSKSAQNLVPEIKDVLLCLEEQQGCRLARMSGSGSTCFGLFESSEMCQQAGEEVKKTHSHWWVRPVVIGG
ncbi:MAG: 4-(cytidine 5'-diphospho)-2-C-methyl-D-erythritol kinase [Alphaproteobacteria bacterium]|nr:4-(cytidine 5'-diphospho)-2-C-methyl-D-erythritol kinase [Alphaproteobacteria bacterium]